MRIRARAAAANLEVENTSLRQQLAATSDWKHHRDRRPKMKGGFEVVQQVAATPVTVLLQGESGTGQDWWRGRSTSSPRTGALVRCMRRPFTALLEANCSRPLAI